MPSSVSKSKGTVVAWATYLVLLLFATLTVGTPSPRNSLAARQLNSTSWQQYVRAPSSKTIPPVTWLDRYSTGDITNPAGLVGDGDGVTTLTRKDEKDTMPSIVLDFGQNYVGILSINFARATVFNGSDVGVVAQASGQPSGALPGIALAFSESLEYLTNRSDFTRSDNAANADKVTNGTDQIAVQKEAYTWTDQLGCQYRTASGNKVCADGLHGFRYLRITLQALPSDAPYTTAFGSVSISSLSLALSAYLGTPDTFTSFFECSDASLTQWWYDAVYTNDLCTDVFRANDTDVRNTTVDTTLLGKQVLHDGAKRDRDPYVGDVAVSALTLYLSHDNPAPARNVLADLAVHQRADGWIPPASIDNYSLALYDYPLWWVVCSSNLVLYTGDTEYLDEYYDTMVRTLDTYYPNSTNAAGLLQKGLGTSDDYGDYAFVPRSGVISYHNALYVLALKRAAQLAEFKGEAADAAKWTARASIVGPALLLENWDSSVGALYDGTPCTTNGTGKCAVHSQDGNSLAILSGATNNSAALSLLPSSSSSSSATTLDETILSYLTKALARPYGNAFFDFSTLDASSQYDQRVYAFISYFELAARFQTVLNLTASRPRDAAAVAASAFDQLRRTYGHMAANDPFSTFWEGIGPNGSYYEEDFTSLAHGWSTGIVPLMQTYVLGVTPTGVGFATYDVKPVTVGGGLRFARGVVSAPGGAIAVDWTVDDVQTGAGLALTVASPAATSGTVYVPVASDDARVSRNQEVIWIRNEGVVEGVSNVRAQNGYVVVDVEGGSTNVFETGT